MNDLTYSEWMKFQKSFFWYESDQEFIDELINFFTKASWPDGSQSRSLIIGFPGYETVQIGPRIIRRRRDCGSIRTLMVHLERATESADYDFVFIDMRQALPTKESWSDFLTSDCDQFFSNLRESVKRDRYCGLLVPLEKPTEFPIPWALAIAGRTHLRLRDEKIGLFRDSSRQYYCLFFQSNEDERPSELLTSDKLRTNLAPYDLPTWVIPRPPPRRKGELLHPAKFPETLVARFIEIFTKEGETVFDPMVGTGSSVLAALRTKRSGIGVDLIPNFIEIAKARVLNEFPSSLLQSHPLPQFKLIQGDATKLFEIQELQNTRFDYCITSPPYWSVLTSNGSEYQQLRRERKLPLVYSQLESDIGNIDDYDRFLKTLVDIYEDVASFLKSDGHLTVVAKNVKRKHVVYPLAWDIATRLACPDGSYEYLGTTLWCQDDISIRPFALGTHWVSNVLHHYCLHFKVRS